MKRQVCPIVRVFACHPVNRQAAMAMMQSGISDESELPTVPAKAKPVKPGAAVRHPTIDARLIVSKVSGPFALVHWMDGDAFRRSVLPSFELVLTP